MLSLLNPFARAAAPPAPAPKHSSGFGNIAWAGIGGLGAMFFMPGLPAVAALFAASGMLFGKKGVIGASLFLFGGMADYELFHNNPGGMKLLSTFKPFFQGIYDGLGITAYGINPEFAAAGAGMTLDPTTGLPVAVPVGP